MTTKYWVGELYVDLTRNQITQKEKTLNLAPKALSVLTMLAENQGSVVSQEEILDNVWKDTIVTPNTLQRSIAQLRKALGDDAKQQKAIRTHSKQGYSLELQVNWQQEAETSDASPQENEQAETIAPPPALRSRKITYALGALIISLMVIGIVLLKPSHREAVLSISAFQAMSATDHSEFYASYSDDSHYIIFTRHHIQRCQNRIWAKHIASQRETALTPWGNYGQATLSPDGKTLAFIEKQSCEPPLPEDPCFTLKQVDFEQALTGNAHQSTLMTCSNAEIKRPQWLTDQTLVLMHRSSTQWQLLKFSVEDDRSEIFYQPQDGRLLNYDLSRSKSRLSVVKLNDASQPVLDLLTTDGEPISSHAIQEHPDIAQNKLFYPRFIPNQALLVFSTGRQLFSLSYQGKIERIDIALDEPMSTPWFNKSGTRAIVTKGHYDSDIGIIDLPNPTQFSQPSLTEEDITNIARTNASEDDPIVQPGGDIIAFKSSRSGTQQLWLSQGDTLTQLTDLPLDSRINGFRWAKDGKSLLFSNDGQLFLLTLNGIQQDVDVQGPVSQLFYWNSDTNTALVNIRIKGELALAEINVNTGEYLKLKDTPVYWADKSPDGRLIYQDNDFQYWQSFVSEDVLIRPLRGQGSYKRFILVGETIYGISRDDQLWTYDLEQQSLTHLANLPPNIDSLTDIHNHKLVLSYVISSKKEIVELTIGD